MRGNADRRRYARGANVLKWVHVMSELRIGPNPGGKVDVNSFPMASPGDVSALRAAIAGGEIRADHIVGVLVKTEGNGLANDFTRELAETGLIGLLGDCLGISGEEVSYRICIVCSGGTEGLITPHMTVLSVSRDLSGVCGPPRLALGRARVASLASGPNCTASQAAAVQSAVRDAMTAAGIVGTADVHFVLVKAALPSDLDGAAQQLAKPGLRGACALGVAMALEEVSVDAVRDEVVCVDDALWSRCACVTAANGQQSSEVLLLGNSIHWGGDLLCGSTVLADMMDSPAVASLLRSMGLDPQPQLPPDQSSALRAVFLKGEPPHGHLRGERHAMWSDSDVHALRHYRAAVGGMLSAVLGTSRFYLSAGAEHQGPPGGACLSVVARVPPSE